MVGDEDIASFEFTGPDGGLFLDARGHTSEVDGEMRCCVLSLARYRNVTAKDSRITVRNKATL